MPQECYQKGPAHLEAQTLTVACLIKRQPLKQHRIDTEAGMLLGISQKHNMRSSPCRFTEFCNSQCLSHFAAPFIVVRAEASVAESCEDSTVHERRQKFANLMKVVFCLAQTPPAALEEPERRSRTSRRPKGHQPLLQSP